MYKKIPQIFEWMKKIYIKVVKYILNFFDFFYQKKIINFLKDKLNQKQIIFFDVGSHFGESVDLFVKYFKIKEFHCFEASPKNFDILKNRLKNSSYKHVCNLNNFGIGHKNYKTFINQTQESSSSTINNLNLKSDYFLRKLKVLNISDINSYIQRIPVEIISLDYYIKKNDIKIIDILKIDTEGFELEVLKGLKENFHIVNFVYFEHHYDNMIVKNYTFSDIHDLLNKAGFIKRFRINMPFRKSFEYIYQNSKS